MIRKEINLSHIYSLLTVQIICCWNLISYYDKDNASIFYPENISNFYIGISLAIIALIISFLGFSKYYGFARKGKIKPNLNLILMKWYIALPMSCTIMAGFLYLMLYFQGKIFFEVG